MGRPRKYETKEERLKVAAERAREKYARGRVVNPYTSDPTAEKFRGTQAYSIFHNVKSRAKKQGLPFDLDFLYVQALLDKATVCPLLSVTYDQDRYRKSLDKIIPALGYVKGDVWIVSYRANTIKNDASLEELESIVKGLEAALNSKLSQQN